MGVKADRVIDRNYLTCTNANMKWIIEFMGSEIAFEPVPGQSKMLQQEIIIGSVY